MNLSQVDLPLITRDCLHRYRETNFLVWKHFLTTEGAQELLSITKDASIRPVTCGEDGRTFGEQKFPLDHPLSQFLARIGTFLLPLTLQGSIKHFTCWTSVYTIGQYIDRHKDRAGSIQIIICLQAPGHECGGELLLHLDEGTNRIDLQPGDAVIFKATSIEHSTTPLVATASDPQPKRVVAVGRYYMHS